MNLYTLLLIRLMQDERFDNMEMYFVSFESGD